MSKNILNSVITVLSHPLLYLAYGTFIWVYASSIKGLHRIGKEPLKLASYYVDSHLGMKPFGSLSLSLALVYFAGIGLVFFSFLSISLPIFVLLLALILLGVILFFLPLSTIHQRMLGEKRLARKTLDSHFKRIVETLDHPLHDIENSSYEDIRNLFALEIMERKVSAISEWPFDMRTLSWLSAIVFTVIGAIITRYVLAFIGL